MSRNEIWLIRHGETPWSLSGQHTGWSDLALNEEGERQASSLKPVLAQENFDAVYCSPLQRARRTCQLAGLDAQAVYLDQLREWNYGSLEGKTATEIRHDTPDWSIWTHGTPDGESIDQVYARTAEVISKASEVPGTVALFAHGHLLRILAANYLGLPPQAASLFALSTASISVLGWERENRVIRRWNWTLENR